MIDIYFTQFKQKTETVRAKIAISKPYQIRMNDVIIKE